MPSLVEALRPLLDELSPGERNAAAQALEELESIRGVFSGLARTKIIAGEIIGGKATFAGGDIVIGPDGIIIENNTQSALWFKDGSDERTMRIISNLSGFLVLQARDPGVGGIRFEKRLTNSDLFALAFQEHPSIANMGYLDINANNNGVHFNDYMMRRRIKESVTIDTGEVTVRRSYIEVDTEGGAGSDNLDTINYIGSLEDGMMIMVTLINAAHDVTITESGNCQVDGGTTRTLGTLNDTWIARFDSGSGKWCEIGYVSP